MKSSKINNSKNNSRTFIRNISAGIAFSLAFVTLLQAGVAKSTDIEEEAPISMKEAQLLAEIESFIMLEDETLDIETRTLLEIEEGTVTEVRVFNAKNELIASGNPSQDQDLRKLVNKADFLSQLGSSQYYRVSE